jgi:hypothetical protein
MTRVHECHACPDLSLLVCSSLNENLPRTSTRLHRSLHRSRGKTYSSRDEQLMVEKEKECRNENERLGRPTWYSPAEPLRI